MEAPVVLAATVAGSAVAGLIWQQRSGRLRSVASRVVDDDARRVTPDELRALGVTPGERATLVQFSSAFCAPCRATRQLLRHVADSVPGTSYGEIDAESHLDVVRRFNVLRTPTVLVLDASGRVVQRASGQPRKADVLAALQRAVDYVR